MKKRKATSTDTKVVLSFELLEANRVMSNRNKSNARRNASIQLYQRIYKGSGIRLLTTQSKCIHYWAISYKTHGRDYETGLDTIDPHVMNLVIKEKCPLSTAAVKAGQLWAEHIMPDMAVMHIEPTAIYVTIRSYNP